MLSSNSNVRETTHAQKQPESQLPTFHANSETIFEISIENVNKKESLQEYSDFLEKHLRVIKVR